MFYVAGFVCRQDARFGKAARKGVIGRILVVDSKATGKMPRIKASEVEIYVSDDNIKYKRYKKPFDCRMFVVPARNAS